MNALYPAQAANAAWAGYEHDSLQNRPSRGKADYGIPDELWGLAADTCGLLGTSSTSTGTGTGASAASTLFTVLTAVLAAALGVTTLSSVAALGVTGFGIALAGASSTSTGGTGSSACLAITGLSVTALGVTGLSVTILARNLNAALGGAGSIILGVTGLGIAGDTAALAMAIVAIAGVVFGTGSNLTAGDFA